MDKITEIKQLMNCIPDHNSLLYQGLLLLLEKEMKKYVED